MRQPDEPASHATARRALQHRSRVKRRVPAAIFALPALG